MLSLLLLSTLILIVEAQNQVLLVQSGGAGGDRHPRCQEWAGQGECVANPFWMKPNCQDACNSQGADYSNALDIPSGARGLALNGGNSVAAGNPSIASVPSATGPPATNPVNNPTVNPANNPVNTGNVGGTGTATGCQDYNDLCTFFAFEGRCARQQDNFYMKQNCRLSCRLCEPYQSG